MQIVSIKVGDSSPSNGRLATKARDGETVYVVAIAEKAIKVQNHIKQEETLPVELLSR
jgi:hypothetical protein